MYTKFIPKNIQEKLKAKERALAYKVSGANESDVVGVIKPQDIQSRTTFVRMCSNKVDSIKNILISGGKVGDFDGKSRFGLNEAIDGSDLYEKRKSGIRPVAGIKSIEVNYKGSYKAIREATVNWVVGSIEELDELTPYFLTVGKTVVLDWGWVNSNVKNFAQMYNDTPFITWQQEGEYYKVDQSIFTDAQVRVQKMGGDYDAIGGKVSNFEMTMRTDGGFDCVTKITAIGSALFAKPIDRPTNQISIIAKPMSDDEKQLLQKLEPTDEEKIEIEKLKERITTDKQGDNLINALINLPNIIKHNVLGWPVKGGELKEVVTGNWNPFVKNVGNKSLYDNFQSKLYHIDEDYAIAVDTFKNAQVCWVVINGENKFFVKWGYMEDQIMNRYLAYDAGEGDANDIKITFRSIKTVTDENGLPQLNDDLKEAADNTSEDSDFLKTDSFGVDPAQQPNIYIIQSGDNLDDIATSNNTSIAVLQGLNPSITNINQINVGQEIVLPDTEDIPGQNRGQQAAALGYDTSAMATLLKASKNPGYSPEEIKKEKERDEAKNLKAFFDLQDTVSQNSKTTAHSDNIPSKDMYEFEKEPTKIRNCYGENNFFYPIDAFKFWSPELLPPFEKIGEPPTEFKGEVSFPKLDVGEFGDGRLFNEFYKKLKEDPDGVFKAKKFTTGDGSNTGILRNMWVNVEEIQKAFGIDTTSKSEAKANPPGTFENGIKALLQSLNSNFYGIWNFELAIDPYDSTNMGVIDKKVNTLGKNSLNYTTFLSDDVVDKEGNFSHKVSDLGIYKFPSFKAGSIVKNQNLAFKIPDSMALTIMYGSNKPDKTETSNAAYNSPELMKLFSRQKSNKYDDKYLQNMMPANVSKDEKVTAQNVGSHKTNPNSKIVRDSQNGINIDTNVPWYKQWSGDTQILDEKESDPRPPKIQLSFDSANNIVQIRELSIKVGSKGTTSKKSGMTTGNTEKLVVLESAKGNFEQINASPSLFIYSGMSSLKLHKDAEKLIRSRLNGSLKVEENDFLKVDTIIPADLSLEIDGIGGISPGDLVHTNYIQREYVAEIFENDKSYGPYTYFQVFGLSQRVDASIWTTELTTKMRINHIPNNENLRIGVETIKKEIIPPPPKRPNIPVVGHDADMAGDLSVGDLDFDDIDFESWPKPPNDVSSIPSLEDAMLPPADNPPIVLAPTGIDQIPDVTKPVIPVPMDEEDIADDLKIDDLDFDFPNFDDWEKPPAPPKPKVEKKKENQKKKDASTKKFNPPPPKKSTYRADNADNTILYDIVPKWRTKLASTAAEQANGNYKNQIIYNESSEQGAVPVRVRAQFWNDNIEPKNSDGISDREVVNKSKDDLIALKTYFNTVKINEYNPSDRNQWYKDEPAQ